MATPIIPLLPIHQSNSNNKHLQSRHSSSGSSSSHLPLTAVRPSSTHHASSHHITSSQPSTHRTTSLPPKLQLEYIIGHTSLTPSSLTSNTQYTRSPSTSHHPTTDEIAYLANNTVVFYSPTTNQQTRYIVAREYHTITAIAYSPGGQYIAVGDTGKTPCVMIYRIDTLARSDREKSSENEKTSPYTPIQPISILNTSKTYGITQIRWGTMNQETNDDTSNMMILTVGTEHDLQLTLYTHVLPTTISQSNQVNEYYSSTSSTTTPLHISPVWQITTENKVNSVDISKDLKNPYFVIAGSQYMSYYYYHITPPPPPGGDPSSSSSPSGGGVTIQVDPPIHCKLGVHVNEVFHCIVCGIGKVEEKVYALTMKGILCQFKSKLLKLSGSNQENQIQWELEKWVDLRLEQGYSLTHQSESMIGISGHDCKVRLFDPSTLQHITTLPKPMNFLASATSTHPPSSSQPSYTKISCVATHLYPDLSKIVCLYSDRSLMIWNITNIQQHQPITLYRSSVSHSGYIWDIQYIPSSTQHQRPQNSTKPLPAGHHPNDHQKLSHHSSVEPADTTTPLFPEHTFVTCSSDHTIRVWHLGVNLNDDNNSITTVSENPKNPSKNLQSVESYTSHQLSMYYVNDSTSVTTPKPNEKDEGFRCIVPMLVTPKSLYLASGDKYGNLRIHTLCPYNHHTSHQLSNSVLLSIAAHNKEMKCIGYHPHTYQLVSGSRDTMLHLYDFTQSFTSPVSSESSEFIVKTPQIQTYATHSSTITSCQVVTTHGATTKLISTSTDKSIVFRVLHTHSHSHASSESHTHSDKDHDPTILQTKSTIHDSCIHPSQKYMITCSADKSIRVYDIHHSTVNKQTRIYRLNQCHTKGSHTSKSREVVSEPLKIRCDPSGMYLAVYTYPDKYVHIVDYYTGVCLNHVYSPCTNMQFSLDSQRLILVNDGTITVYRLDRSSSSSNNETHRMNVRDSPYHQQNTAGVMISSYTTLASYHQPATHPLSSIASSSSSSSSSDHPPLTDRPASLSSGIPPVTARRVTKTALDFLHSDDEDEGEDEEVRKQKHEMDEKYRSIEVDLEKESDSEKENREKEEQQKKKKDLSLEGSHTTGAGMSPAEAQNHAAVVSHIQPEIPIINPPSDTMEEKSPHESPSIGKNQKTEQHSMIVNLSHIQLSPIQPLHPPPVPSVSESSPHIPSSHKPLKTVIPNSQLPVWAQSTVNPLTSSATEPTSSSVPVPAASSSSSGLKRKWQRPVPQTAAGDDVDGEKADDEANIHVTVQPYVNPFDVNDGDEEESGQMNTDGEVEVGVDVVAHEDQAYTHEDDDEENDPVNHEDVVISEHESDQEGDSDEIDAVMRQSITTSFLSTIKPVPSTKPPVTTTTSNASSSSAAVASAVQPATRKKTSDPAHETPDNHHVKDEQVQSVDTAQQNAPQPISSSTTTTTIVTGSASAPPIPDRPARKTLLSSLAAFGVVDQPATAAPAREIHTHPSSNHVNDGHAQAYKVDEGVQALLPPPLIKQQTIDHDFHATQQQQGGEEYNKNLIENDAENSDVDTDTPQGRGKFDATLSQTQKQSHIAQANEIVSHVVEEAKQEVELERNDMRRDNHHNPLIIQHRPPTLHSSQSPHTSPAATLKSPRGMMIPRDGKGVDLNPMKNLYNNYVQDGAAVEYKENGYGETQQEPSSTTTKSSSYKHTFNALTQSINQSLSLFQQLQNKPVSSHTPTASTATATSDTHMYDENDELSRVADEYEDQLCTLRAQLDAVLSNTTRAKQQRLMSQSQSTGPLPLSYHPPHHMRKPSDALSHSSTVSVLNSIDLQQSLDRYSDMLVAAVIQKLDSRRTAS